MAFSIVTPCVGNSVLEEHASNFRVEVSRTRIWLGYTGRGIQNLLQVNRNDEQEDGTFQEEDVVATGGTLQL
jgi:hypothetical protein